MSVEKMIVSLSNMNYNQGCSLVTLMDRSTLTLGSPVEESSHERTNNCLNGFHKKNTNWRRSTSRLIDHRSVEETIRRSKMTRICFFIKLFG